jgi:hypothetical protein
MKLFGTIAVHVAGEAILRTPGFFDKAKRLFGGTPDLSTGKTKASIEAAAIVDAIRDALRSINVSNAVALIVDDITLFHDREGRADDLGDLFLAFHDQAAALGGGFDLLRLTVEHAEAGLHVVMEVQARTEHATDEPAVRVMVSGRISDLEPRPGESADAYRARIEPLTRDRTMLEVSRVHFESFVSRVRDAIQKAMPEARAEVVVAEARIQRPAADGRAPAEPPPDARYYDPYDHYYPSPLGSMLGIMMWSSVFSMAMMPSMVVVNHHNEPTGHVDDPGIEHADPGHGDHGDHGDHGGDHGDVGGDSYGAGDMGGDLGGGDFGGGDFGGFD